MITVHVAGLKELGEALDKLPQAVAKTVLRRVLKKAGEPMAARARQLAPDDPSTNSKDLKRSIKVSSSLSKASRKELKETDRATFAQMHIGPVAARFYGTFLEFGTSNMSPRPFMRPAWDSTQNEALEIIKRELGKEITAGAARYAKKLAKQSAGGK